MPTHKTIVLAKKGAERFRRGQMWVFRVDVKDHGDATPGDVVRAVDLDGNFVAMAFYGPTELTLRWLGRDDAPIDKAFFRARLKAAIDRRAHILQTHGVAQTHRAVQKRDAMRVVHGEADLLPGLLVDKFGDGVVIQSLATATDQREGMFIDLLEELLSPRVIVVRDDGMTREYESLPDRKEIARGSDPRVSYHEGDLRLSIDLIADQKTGAYLDQYENHLLAGEYARGEALDLFSYHGGFGLQMARRATSVRCVDQSEAAVGRIRDNARANDLANVEAVCANAFDHLRALEAEKRHFDTIVIDPPAFAKRKSALDAALRGYKDLNLRALRLLRPGGILFSCSCSAKVTRALFEDMLIAAARDARRKLWILERRGASRDHPGLLGVPETEYLKCFVVQAL